MIIFELDEKAIIANVLNNLAKVYKQFIDNGKFYRLECYGPYYRVVEDEGVGEPYKTIGDWTEELIGNYNQDTYYIYLDELLYNEMPTEKYEEYGDELTEIEWELRNEIMALPIDELEKRIKLL